MQNSQCREPPTTRLPHVMLFLRADRVSPIVAVLGILVLDGRRAEVLRQHRGRRVRGVDEVRVAARVSCVARLRGASRGRTWGIASRIVSAARS
jgi:hypothetical protein